MINCNFVIDFWTGNQITILERVRIEQASRFFQLAVKVGAVRERLGVDEQVAGAHLHGRNDDDRAAPGRRHVAVPPSAAAAAAGRGAVVPFGGRGLAVGRRRLMRLLDCQFVRGFAVRIAGNIVQ